MKYKVPFIFLSIILVSGFMTPSAVCGLENGVHSQATIDTIIVERAVFEPNDFLRRSTFSPRLIGLALSAGGARGIAQIGILKAFEEANIEISYIAGTSMGSIIGGLYASGYSADEIFEIAGKADFSSLFSDSPRRRALFINQRAEAERYLFSIRFDGLKPFIPSGLAVGQGLTTFLSDLTISANYSCQGDFDRLLIPFRAVASDIGNGEEVVLKRGNLADAMRASMAFPLAFTPVVIDGRHLMDGGMVNPVPVDVCRSMGADFVIAINTLSPLMDVDRLSGPVDMVNQATTVMQQEVKRQQLKQADFIITPELGQIENYNLNLRDSIITLGYQAGQKGVAELRLALDQSLSANCWHIESIESQADQPLGDYLLANWPLEPGSYLDPNRINDALLVSDPEMRFEKLSAEIIKTPAGARIIIGGVPFPQLDKLSIRFEGNRVLPDSIINKFFVIEAGRETSFRNLYDVAGQVVQLYRKAGYDLAHIHSLEYLAASEEIVIRFDEGFLQFVDIRGNQRTRSWIIKANFPLRPGEPFDVRKAENGIENIYATGFFERVSLDIRPSPEGARLIINVSEKKFTQIRFGGHWDDEYQAEMFVEVLDGNALGAGIQILGHAHLSSRRNKYFISLRANRLSQTLITAGTRFYFSRLRRRLFEAEGAPRGFRVEDRLGWSAEIGQQIARLGTILFGYRLEKIASRLTLTDAENEDVLSAFAIRSSVETFNKFPFPDYGHRQDFVLEFTTSWLGGTYEEYTKMYSSLEAYWPLGSGLNLHPRLALGVSTATLPDVEKFYIGGLYNFSGFRTDQLSGDKFFTASMQMRIKLPAHLYLIGNFDYGNVYDEYEKLRLKDFQHGWGVALSLDSPIGPLDFGYGNPQKLPDRFYLNIGLKF